MVNCNLSNYTATFLTLLVPNPLESFCHAKLNQYISFLSQHKNFFTLTGICKNQDSKTLGKMSKYRDFKNLI